MSATRLFGALLLFGCAPPAWDALDTAALAARAPWATTFRHGCLEVGVHLARHPDVPRSRVVLQFELGNRCEGAARVDLAAVRVTARVGDDWLPLAAYDPNRELRVVTLDRRARVLFAVAWGDSLAAVPREVCVAPGRIAPDGEVVEAPRVCLQAPAWEALPLARGGSR